MHELASALLARIAATAAGVRAWAHVDRAAALEAASRLDDTPLPERGPAFGLPLGVKDIVDTEEWPTEFGSPVGSGRRPAHDAACVARWRAGKGGPPLLFLNARSRAIAASAPPRARWPRRAG